MKFFTVLAVGLALASSLAFAQDVGKSSKENAEAAAAFAEAEAKRYEILIGKSKKPLHLEEKTLLRWSNPVRAEVYGSVVLWTQDECPEALASIYKFFDRKQVNVELVSLSASPLSASRSGKPRWETDAGVAFQALMDGPEPAATTEKRQLQLRSLARTFTAHLAERDDDSKFSELRLMARPLYQYTASDDSGREGAVFAFVTTTDPEVLLILEAKPEGGKRTWRYAAARLHFCRLQLKLDDKVVWDVPQVAPPWDALRGPRGDYVILQWDTVEGAEADTK